MELTKLAQGLKESREKELDLTEEQDVLASCAGTENFGYALFDGGYIKPEDWVVGEDLAKLKEAVALVEEFKNLFESLATDF